MIPSVTDAVHSALERTRKVLFRPFSLKKWFILGFCSFLATLGRGGCSAHYNVHGEDPGRQVGRAAAWISSHPFLVLALAAGGLVVGLAIKAVLVWLSSRGTFMFLDGVVRDRGAVSEPWHRLADPAYSYFLLRFTVVAGMAFLSVLILLCCAILAWPSLMSQTFDYRARVALIVGASTFLPLGLLYVLVRSILSDFIAPIMYIREIDAGPAAVLFWRQLFLPHFTSIVLFYLCKLALAIIAGLGAILAVVFTCCLAAIPYLGSVILLPFTVFFRSYSIFYLSQFGQGWDIMRAVSALREEPQGGEGEMEPPCRPS